jgi:hypothetical protein
LLEELAQWRHAILRIPPDLSQRSTTAEWPAGTGPFKLVSFLPRESATLAAYEGYWSGRPFVDRVDVQMGVSLREQAIALELGRADLVDLGPAEFRRAAQAGRRTWASSPAELLAMVYSHGPGARDSQIGKALALSIDRASIHAVLLQRQGEPSAALLPQWLSGYAFLFKWERDLDGARKLWAAVARKPDAIVMRADPQDLLAQAVAGRIVVNAREAGLPLEVDRAGTSPAGSPDLVLARFRIARGNAGLALQDFREGLDLGLAFGELVANSEAQSLFAAEDSFLGTYRVIPIAHLPVMYGLSPRVKSWMPTRLGEWRLADVWIDEQAGRKQSAGETPAVREKN